MIVTHHPFDLPEGYPSEHLVGRASMAMQRFAEAGADLFLAGHLHVSHVGPHGRSLQHCAGIRRSSCRPARCPRAAAAS